MISIDINMQKRYNLLRNVQGISVYCRRMIAVTMLRICAAVM